MSNVADLYNAGDPVTVAWITWQNKMSRECFESFPYPACNIMATEQLYKASASQRRCYLCGHSTTHRQTTAICFPPQGAEAWICKECDEDND